MSNEPHRNDDPSTHPLDREMTGSSEELRRRFHTFINDEVQFRKFIKACNDSPPQRRRLRFWQQEIWSSFIEQHPEFAHLDDMEIRDAFYICHVHLMPLRQVEIPIRKGLWSITYSPEGVKILSEKTPYSTPFALDSSAWGDATHITVDHCDECVACRERHGL